MGHVPLPKPPPFPAGYLPPEERLRQALSVLEKRLERLEGWSESLGKPVPPRDRRLPPQEQRDVYFVGPTTEDGPTQWLLLSRRGKSIQVFSSELDALRRANDYNRSVVTGIPEYE